ncbi:MAG: ferredoxin-thioredoxin reductase catalytic domain-containing protein [Candidatus Woesearchaeota archaeon]
MPDKKYWRCHVCNDIHYGVLAPEICPTCSVKNAYCEMDEIEAATMMQLELNRDSEILKGKELRKAWKTFTENNDFILNPDNNHVDMIIKGVENNQKACGLKLCPCRLRDKEQTKKRDLDLVCPCNFKTHSTWSSKGMCWCGLFITSV